MELVLTTTNSLPWSPTTGPGRTLTEALDQHTKGVLSAGDREKAYKQVVKEVIVEQVKVGVELCTDGQIRWPDSVSHLAGRLAGVVLGQALPFLTTGTTYRQPIITGKITSREALLRDEFAYARSFMSPKSMKPVLTGPYTLAKLSHREAGPYTTLQEVTLAYAEALAHELDALRAIGAELIQVDEPAILQYPEDFEILRAGLVLLAQRKASMKLGLYVYGGDVTPLYEYLQSLPVDLLGLDFTTSPGLTDCVAALGSDKPLGLGLIDARSPDLETAAQLVPCVERLLPKIKGEIAYLNPSAGLRALPRDRAFKKLGLMRDVKRHLLVSDS